jgi:predicted TIM-barrel fold metal-dependent hydrolase
MRNGGPERGQTETSDGTFRIIDAHVHVGRGQIPTDPLMSNIHPDHILGMMEDSGVSLSILFAPHCPRGYAEANEEISGYVSDRPDKFIAFCRLRSKPPVGQRSLWRRAANRAARALQTSGPGVYGVSGLTRLLREDDAAHQKQCLEEVRRCFEDCRFSGLKIHPAQDGLPSHEVLGLVHELRKPILFHCGAGIDIGLLEREIIRRYSIPIILAHMGGYAAERALYGEAISLAKTYANVYLDTSYVFFQYVLEMALAACPTKVIFGSDAPGVHPNTSIACILSLRVSNEVKQMVFADNVRAIVAV